MTERTVSDLLHLFLQTNNLNQLVELAAQVLKNPLLVCDTSYHFIAHSTVRGIRDKSWLAGTKRGSWSYELVSMINALDLDYTGDQHKTHILSNINTESTSRRKIGTLCIDGVHLGYYFVLEEWTSFDHVPENVYLQVESILAKCVCTERSLQNPDKLGAGDGERIIMDLLQNGFENRRLFSERVAKHELSHLGTYRVFCIIMDGAEHTHTDSDFRELRSVIGRCLPLSWQAYVQGCIVILANFHSEASQDEQNLDRFKAFLTERHLSAGQSDYFSDPYHLKLYYEQAYAAAYLSRAFQDERKVIPYEEYKIYNLFHSVKDKNLFTLYSSEAVRAIADYDHKNGTAYLETIFHYLANQCSVHKAADQLYVHRNTVAYRVARARELFGLDFDDSYANYINFTSCLLWKFCERFQLHDEQTP